MKIRPHVLTLLLLIGVSANSFAQDSELLASIPKTKNGYLKSEKNVLATINWLENTQLNDDAEKHAKQLNLLTEWMATTPTVNVIVNKNIVNFRGPLITMFMAGYTKYALENNHSKDELQLNLAGLRTAMKFYKNKNGLRIDGEMDVLVELENKGQLEQWVKDQLAKK
jgi:hypothetical protein